MVRLNDNKTIERFLSNFNLGVYQPFPRSAIKFIQNHFDDKEMIGAEIGVYRGDNAKSIMKTLPIKKLYLIDPYEEYEGFTNELINLDVSQLDLRRAREIAGKRLSKYGNKIVFVQKKSSDALENIPDNLDFVYLDGNHFYKYIKEDMENYYKKVRDGGILAGHDIQNGFCKEKRGITLAFVDFVKEKNLKPFIQIPDWWVIKEGIFKKEMIYGANQIGK